MKLKVTLWGCRVTMAAFLAIAFFWIACTIYAGLFQAATQYKANQVNAIERVTK